MAHDDGIGRRVREIRTWRGMSLRAVAGLAGISEGHLSNIERGRRSLDSRHLVNALAAALCVAPSDLGLATLGSGLSGGTTEAVQAVRRVLLAADVGVLTGDVVPVPDLARRAEAVLAARQDCRDAEVGALLPRLLGDLHVTAAATPDALRWLVLVSVHAAQGWLRDVGAPLDLSWRAAVHAQRAADRLGDEHVGAVAAFGLSRDLVLAGLIDVAARCVAEAAAQLDTSTADGQQLGGVLALSTAMVAAADRRHDDVAAPLAEAAERAARSGQRNDWWFDFGPQNVLVWRLAIALEVGDHAAAVRLAETGRPSDLTARSRRSAYWLEYGRALAHIRGRADDATRALRQAEDVYPARVRRSAFAREAVLTLLPRARTDATRRELRGLAYRMGLAA